MPVVDQHNGYITFNFNHEATANFIEGGDWIPTIDYHGGTASMICRDVWGETDVSIRSRYHYPYFRVDFTSAGSTITPMEVSTDHEILRRYIDYAQRKIVAGIWTATERFTSYPETEEHKKMRLQRRIRMEIRARWFPSVIVHRDRVSLPTAADIREQRARETLRRVIGESKWRDFVKNGFVSVRAKSGRIYQLFPSHKITNVYDKGVMVERLCVVLVGNFPPTDSLIARYLMVLNNEKDFRDRAVKHSVGTITARTLQGDRPTLVEFARGLAS